jgi:hypothetical protein
MTIRVELPGGQWAELRGVDDLTGVDQDDFLDTYDKLVADKPRPEPKPDPDNPAVQAAAEPVKLTSADNRVLRDWLIGRFVTAWSFDLPLPYTAASRERLPVKACNALQKAIKPMQDALVDDDDGDDGDEAGPKSGPVSGTGGSTGTSPDGSPSPLPAPPAVTSATP